MGMTGSVSEISVGLCWLLVLLPLSIAELGLIAWISPRLGLIKLHMVLHKARSSMRKVPSLRRIYFLVLLFLNISPNQVASKACFFFRCCCRPVHCSCHAMRHRTDVFSLSKDLTAVGFKMKSSESNAK